MSQDILLSIFMHFENIFLVLSPDHYKSSPLWYGAKPVTKLLDAVGKKIIFKAIKNQDVIGVKEILKSKINLNIRDKEGDTPLHNAVAFGHFEIVEILVKNGANIYVRNFKNEEPLDTAITKGHYTISKYLLENGTDDGEEFHVPLELAIMNCRVDLVKLLLWHGAWISGEFENEYPLQIAIGYQSLEIIKVLLENGADPNYSDDPMGDTFPIIEMALETGNWEIINMLLKHGADGSLFLRRAIYATSRLANLEMLLKNGVKADISIVGCDRALSISESDTKKVLNLLIRFGANVNYQDEDLQTPLHYATEYKNYKLLKVLMQNGANPNLKDDVGESSIEKTLQYKSTNYFKAILYNQSYF